MRQTATRKEKVSCWNLPQLADSVRLATPLARFGKVVRTATNQRVGSSNLSGTADDGLAAHISHTLGMWEFPLAKDLPGRLYLQRALSNEFLLGAPGTSFFDQIGIVV